MPIKDSVVRWYIQNVIRPRHEVIDKPGFIIDQFSDKAGRVYLREIALSERLLENIEKNIVDKYGDKGRQALYSAGKKFGYRHSLISNFSTIKNASEKEIKKLGYSFVRFVECTWAHRITHMTDIPKKEAEIIFDDYIVCRNNGIGHLLTEGTCTGFWSYTMDDPSLEGVQTKCQGRGDKKCTLVCGPPDSLSRRGLKFFREIDLANLEKDDRYDVINKIRDTKYARNSFKKLVDSGFLKYHKGIIEHNNERFFLVETSLLYLLEMEIGRLKSGDALLFDIAFDFGKEIAKKEGETGFGRFITDFFSSLGWGDMIVTKKSGQYNVISHYFPWTKFSDQINFSIYRGILSGIIAESTGKRIVLNKSEKVLTKDGFSLLISES